MLKDILDYVKTEGLEYSLMMDLVWNHDKKLKFIIEDLFNNLFDEPFEQVCEELYSSVRGLLFSGLPHYITQSITKNLIYDNNGSDSSALLNKSETVFDLIKLLNSSHIIQKHTLLDEIRKFSEYGSKYILQKSVFKNYDYFPDFVILKRETELILVHYNIKRVINENKQKVYKILFKNKSLPFSLKGIFRDTFLDADVNVVQMDGNENTLDQFQEDLFAKWGFRSEIYLNKHGKEEYYTSKINSEVNKLIS
jgi:hypothetical protein